MEHEVTGKSEEVFTEESPKQCVHHWIIAPAYGPVSKGTCKICGQEKEFLNSISESLWKKMGKKDGLTSE